MRFTETPIPQLFLVDLDPHFDSRGYFARAWCQRELSERGLSGDCAQANLSYNARRGTLRGLHDQQPPHTDAKFVRVLKGAVHDVVLDLRDGSPTYGTWFVAELNADNRRGVFVPQGCAHGYLTLTDDAELLYLVSAPHCPNASRGIRWTSPALRGAWPFEPGIISVQDSSWPEALAQLISL